MPIQPERPERRECRVRRLGTPARRSARPALLVGGLIAASALGLAAQQWGGWRPRRGPVYTPDQAADPSGFMFCRLMYTSVRREWLGHGWDTDYPDSDRNLMLRLSQLTTAGITTDAAGEPFHAVVGAVDDQLFRCPFLFTSDVGTLAFSDEEADRLREYLLKGGFLWVDDFWGDQAWRQWEREIASVLPPDLFPIVDVPTEHLMLHTLYNVRTLPQVPSIQYWRRTGRQGTSERGAESAVPSLRAILDEHGRALVVMTHNTDIADGWEREGEDDQFFFQFSSDAYAVGINLVLYSMTH